MRKKNRRSRLELFRLGMTARQEKLFDTLLFLVKVIVLSIPLYFIILLGVSLYPLQYLDATVSSGILRALGYAVQQEGNYITVGTASTFSFILSEDCTAWKSMLFLFALIFAVPKIELKKRLLGLGLGIPVLWMGNQARIVGVVITERATSEQFALFTHDYFWRILLVLLVLGVWLVWLKNPGFGLWKCPPTRRPKVSRRPRLLTRKTKR
jgi:exosortase/archaeosortase family protein